MPMYYFDVRENGCFIPDRIGTELDDVAAAEREAAEAAAAIARDRLPGSKAQTVRVEVRDATGHILTATATLSVERAPRVSR